MKQFLPIVIAAISPFVGRKIKSMMWAMFFMAVSMFFVFLATLFAIGTLFFALAQMDQFITPTLITAGVVLLVGLLCGWEGAHMLSGKVRRFYE